jgi:hypothetical protein
VLASRRMLQLREQILGKCVPQIYCSDYKCSHWTAISGEQWPDHVRPSVLEPLFTRQACGTKGTDARPDFSSAARRATVLQTRARPDIP